MKSWKSRLIKELIKDVVKRVVSKMKCINTLYNKQWCNATYVVTNCRNNILKNIERIKSIEDLQILQRKRGYNELTLSLMWQLFMETIRIAISYWFTSSCNDGWFFSNALFLMCTF